MEENRAPMRSILKMLMKSALLCGTSSKFRRFFIKNRAPVRSILKILKKIVFPCGASSKFHRSFVQNRTPVRSILNILNKIALVVSSENGALVRSILTNRSIRKLLLSKHGACSSRPVSSGAIRRKLRWRAETTTVTESPPSPTSPPPSPPSLPSPPPSPPSPP